MDVVRLEDTLGQFLDKERYAVRLLSDVVNDRARHGLAGRLEIDECFDLGAFQPI